MNKTVISKVCGREILDSRGNPTLEASVYLSDGTLGIASVPSGASTGIFESHEKRDGDRGRYSGLGVASAVASVNTDIAGALCGMSPFSQREIDRTMISLDGSENKSELGANAILAVSLACARAAANSSRQPLFRYMGGLSATSLPVPMMNILNGGKHASNNIDIQEFMIVPLGAPNFAESVRIGAEIYKTLGAILRSEGYSTAVGDEGGYAPSLESDEDALVFICRAIESAGYSSEDVKIALDCAASEWFDDGSYLRPKRGERMNVTDLISYYSTLCDKYPICSIEDGLDQQDFEGWSTMTRVLGGKIMLVGDDLFVTNTERLAKGISKRAANAILIKPNQIGTLSETIDVINLARKNSYKYILSHRSGETEDTTISDIAVALGAGYIKAGAPCRSERTAKYNRLIRIEAALGSACSYGEGKKVLLEDLEDSAFAISH